jgi:hypothetical protein
MNCLNDMKALMLICATALAFTGLAKADSAESLLDKYKSLASGLQQNQFKRALVLYSTESPSQVAGDIHAVVDYPFETLRSNLNTPQHWCEVISLHSNTKYCRAMPTSAGAKLIMHIGAKTPEALSRSGRLEFDYRLALAAPDYLSVLLSAQAGPLGTSNYQISLDAIPLPNGKSFLHLTYSYNVSVVGRLAMQAYLATGGRGKVGFTMVGQRPNGEPDYIGGVRGVVERNTMRYYLAIDAFLGSMPTTAATQFEQRLHSWFAATERYPQQLHEMERAEYLTMKRAERVREQAVAPEDSGR